MAIIYKKGNPDLEYTGMDLFMKKAGDFFKGAKNTAKKAATAIPNRIDRNYRDTAKLRRDKNTEMIEKTFGSVEEYENFSNGTSTSRTRKRN